MTRHPTGNGGSHCETHPLLCTEIVIDTKAALFYLYYYYFLQPAQMRIKGKIMEFKWNQQQPQLTRTKKDPGRQLLLCTLVVIIIIFKK